MKIRRKILSGFLILVAMLLVAASISIYQFNDLSDSVQHLIDYNYKTIQACEDMLGALEREDSGILLLLHGEWKEGQQVLMSADSSFRASLAIARKNVTDDGEDALIDDLERQYKEFKSHWERPFVVADKEGSLDWYFENQYQAFIKAKGAVEKLLLVNQESMYASASHLKERAKRALMPGIVAIIAALLFALMFNTFINAYLIHPIKNLIEVIDLFKSKRKIMEVKAESKDELGELTENVNDLLAELKYNDK
jgi:HAMP domain-containing protein